MEEERAVTRHREGVFPGGGTSWPVYRAQYSVVLSLEEARVKILTLPLLHLCVCVCGQGTKMLSCFLGIQ